MNDYGIAVMYTGIVNQFIPHKASTTDASKLSEFLMDQFSVQQLGAGSFGVVVDHPTCKDKVVKLSFHNESYFGESMDSDGYLSFLLFCMRHPHENLPVVHAVHVDHVNKTFAVVLERLTSYDPWTHDHVNANEVAVAVPGLVDTLGLPTDLHYNNFMLRGKTPVLTDPYSRRRTEPPAEYLVSSYKDKNINVEVTRPMVAPASEGTADKLEAQGEMLRDDAFDATDIFRKGMAGPLLQMQHLKLRSKKRSVDSRGIAEDPTAAFRAAFNADFAAIENSILARRLDIRPSAFRSAMGVDVGNIFGFGQGVQDRVQPGAEPGDGASLQELRRLRDAKCITPAEYRRRKAEIYRKAYGGNK